MAKIQISEGSKNYSEFKRLRNLTQRKIKHLKTNFVKKNQLQKNQDKPKEHWQNLRSLGLSNKTNHSMSDVGLESGSNDEINFDGKDVANNI